MGNPSSEGKADEVCDGKQPRPHIERILMCLDVIFESIESIRKHIERKACHDGSSVERVSAKLNDINSSAKCTGVNAEGGLYRWPACRAVLKHLSEAHQCLVSIEHCDALRGKKQRMRDTDIDDIMERLKKALNQIIYANKCTWNSLGGCFEGLYETWWDAFRGCTESIGTTIGCRKRAQRPLSSGGLHKSEEDI
jgi:hypothetical protein